MKRIKIITNIEDKANESCIPADKMEVTDNDLYLYDNGSLVGIADMGVVVSAYMTESQTRLD